MKTTVNKNDILKQLQTIPSVGKSISLNLWDLGVRSVDDLKWKNPQKLYEKSNKLAGVKHNPCLLYTFRCAVYYATEKKLKKEKLDWWYWKDKTYNE